MPPAPRHAGQFSAAAAVARREIAATTVQDIRFIRKIST